MRRPKGSGSILRTPEGKFRALFPFVIGRREEVDGSPFPTQMEAEAALDGILAELRDGGAVRGGKTLARLGEQTLDRREKDGYRAVADDRNRWKNYMATWDLVTAPARTITRGEIREWLAGLSHLATQTRRNALNLLRAVFQAGVDDELLEVNPCDGVKVRDHGSTLDTSTFLAKEEADAVIAASLWIEPAIALAIGTGMRSGELRSLLWSDVHDDHIVVRYGSPTRPTKKGKTRKVPILPIARAALDALPRTHAMVIPAIKGGFRTKGRFIIPAAWRGAKEAAGITRRVRPHDLRHTTATLLLTGAWGEPWSYEEVKEMLGHSSVKVTERYAKATGTLAEKAARGKIGIGSAEHAAIVTQARDILERRGSDSNRRMTVLQSGDNLSPRAALDRLPILVRSYLEAVAENSPHAHARGLDLASVASLVGEAYGSHEVAV